MSNMNQDLEETGESKKFVVCKLFVIWYIVL